MKNIEVEMRARFDRKKYDSLKNFLDKNAKHLGKDDKDVYFFIFKDKLLKVSENVSKQSAKITAKSSRIGRGSAFEELEIPIDQSHVKDAVKMFNSLGFRCINSFQKRDNYLYKGVEIALKHSKNWGHHIEFEIMVNNKKFHNKAEQKIRTVANELKVELMSEKELRKFVANTEKRLL